MITSSFYVILINFNLGIFMKLALSSLALGIIFFGCGGTTSNTTNDAMDNNFTILKGTVPGTLIEAFCDNGSYYNTHSIINDSERHPFEMIIPKQLNCHLIMTTNEYDNNSKIITPLRILTQDGNGTVFNAVEDIAELGFIPLALDRNDIVDENGDGVSDINLEIQVNDKSLIIVTLIDDPLDDDGDGIINIYEDNDNDGINNHDDDDDDNDGIIDSLDSDDNNDGIDDEDEDGDGVKDDDDIDDDNDGFEDEHDFENSSLAHNNSSEEEEDDRENEDFGFSSSEITIPEHKNDDEDESSSQNSSEGYGHEDFGSSSSEITIPEHENDNEDDDKNESSSQSSSEDYENEDFSSSSSQSSSEENDEDEEDEIFNFSSSEPSDEEDDSFEHFTR